MKKRKLLIAIAAILGLLVTSLAALGVVWYYPLRHNTSTDPTRIGSKGTVETEEAIKNRVNVLLIGADQRPQEEKFNTDSLIVASIDPINQRISMLSIPRDTKISIPGYKDVKINSVVALKDIDTLKETVSDLTGLPLAGYIQTNFDGFKQIIDTLGGITINVEKDMYYETGDKNDGFINLKKGVQKLDGAKALQYARFRHDALADISRTARQQEVLKAVAKEMLRVSTLPKLPWLVPQLMQAVHTDLSLTDIFKISRSAIAFNKLDILSQTLPGSFLDLNGVSYWEVDPVHAKKVVSDLLRGITTQEVIGQEKLDLLKPIPVTPAKPLPVTPGNPNDPNGRKSSGYKDFEQEAPTQQQLPDKQETKNELIDQTKVQ